MITSMLARFGRPLRVVIGMGLCLFAALAFVPDAEAQSGLKYLKKSEKSACPFPNRLCRGSFQGTDKENCYNPGDSICRLGKICRKGMRVCVGHKCPSSNPNCKKESIHVRRAQVDCYNPANEVCNRSNPRGDPTCTGIFKLCAGEYGEKCYVPGKERCFKGRTCGMDRRLCEGSNISECYNPATSVCLKGNICKSNEQLCSGLKKNSCYDPKSQVCYDGTVCSEGSRVCSRGGKPFCQPVGLKCSDKAK